MVAYMHDLQEGIWRIWCVYGKGILTVARGVYARLSLKGAPGPYTLLTGDLAR